MFPVKVIIKIYVQLTWTGTYIFMITLTGNMKNQAVDFSQ